MYVSGNRATRPGRRGVGATYDDISIPSVLFGDDGGGFPDWLRQGYTGPGVSSPGEVLYTRSDGSRVMANGSVVPSSVFAGVGGSSSSLQTFAYVGLGVVFLFVFLGAARR